MRGVCVKPATLKVLKVPLEVLDDDQAKDAGADVEGLAFNQDGVVVFDGGSYSAGPEYIGEGCGGRRGAGSTLLGWSILVKG